MGGSVAQAADALTHAVGGKTSYDIANETKSAAARQTRANTKLQNKMDSEAKSKAEDEAGFADKKSKQRIAASGGRSKTLLTDGLSGDLGTTSGGGTKTLLGV